MCGATDGRIAWAGPGRILDGLRRAPGQTNESAATTLERGRRWKTTRSAISRAGRVVASYAHPAFQADSYQAMHAAACLSPADCWFAGDPLEEPQLGAFQLHWNGSALEAEPYPAKATRSRA